MIKVKQWLIVIIPISVVLGVLLLWLNRYNAFDWYVLRNYIPSAEISAIATNSGMNANGTNIFYAHAPKITEQDAFNSACTEGEKTIILGCYTGYDFSTDTDIFIYNVTKPELDGIKEVTAAHEMLHAAYDRLSSNERQRVDALTTAAVSKLNNPRIEKLVKSYTERDASSVPNELHSILGTEVAALDAELEQYYGRYFTNRQVIVALSDKYESVFDRTQNEIDKLQGDLSLRKNEITELETSLDAQNKDLLTAKSQLDQYAASGSIPAYNALVPQYNRKVEQYNATIASYRRLINEYNALIAEYNKKAIYQEDLVNSIDSKYQLID